MNEMIITNAEFGSIRIEMRNGEPWFVGSSIAKVLKYQNQQKAIRDHVDAEDKLTEQIVLAGQRPKEIFADAVSASKTSILIGDLAKLIKQNGVDIGEKRLFQWMRENGYLIRKDGASYNMPTQKSMDLGVMEIKESTITQPNGNVRISRTPKVTGKGQRYFVNKILSAMA